MAYIIYHPHKGIFLGAAHMNPQWSNHYLCESQYYAYTFETAELAQDFMSLYWNKSTFTGATTVGVVADLGNYASMQACVNAGLKAWANECFDPKKHGFLAARMGRLLPLQVLSYRKENDFFIGTKTINDGPISRESEEIYATHQEAQHALDSGNWTQRITSQTF